MEKYVGWILYSISCKDEIYIPTVHECLFFMMTVGKLCLFMDDVI